MKNYWIIFFCFSIFLCSCINEQQKKTEMIGTNISQTPSKQLSTVNTSATPVSTVTFLPSSTVTLVYTPLPTNTELNNDECDKIGSFSTLPKNTMKGIIPLLDNSRKYEDSFLLDLENDQTKLFPDVQKEKLGMGVVSNDGKWFAYISRKEPIFENQYLVITNANDELIKTINLETIIHLEDNATFFL